MKIYIRRNLHKTAILCRPLRDMSHRWWAIPSLLRLGNMTMALQCYEQPIVAPLALGRHNRSLSSPCLATSTGLQVKCLQHAEWSPPLVHHPTRYSVHDLPMLPARQKQQTRAHATIRCHQLPFGLSAFELPRSATCTLYACRFSCNIATVDVLGMFSCRDLLLPFMVAV